MLLLALICFEQNKNTIIFSHEKEEKKKMKEEKKDMQVKSNGATSVKVF